MKLIQEPEPFFQPAPVRLRRANGRTFEKSFGEFRCRICHALVTTQSWLSGVKNRNHCPYCLWSRHLDLFQAGDRLAACKASMQPIGLTLKRPSGKYADPDSGELMLVHRCQDCGKLSINRLAADDDPQTILAVFERSSEIEQSVRAEITSHGIRLLQPEDERILKTGLFGSACRK